MKRSNKYVPDILPCPFCGRSEGYVERIDLSQCAVICNNCNAMGGGGCPADDQDLDIEEELDLYPGYIDAIRNWNKRTKVECDSILDERTGVDND